MRTAEEMINFCDNHGLGKGFNKHWRKKHFELLESQLKPGEDVKVCFIGIHNYISPTKHDGYFAYAITDERFILAQKKIVGQSVQAIMLKNLNDITKSTGIIYGILAFDTYKETFNVAIDKFTIDNIHEMVTKSFFNKDTSKTKNNDSLSQTSIGDELLKYKKLLEDGVITQEEFDTLKNKLLG